MVHYENIDSRKFTSNTSSRTNRAENRNRKFLFFLKFYLKVQTLSCWIIFYTWIQRSFVFATLQKGFYGTIIDLLFWFILSLLLGCEDFLSCRTVTWCLFPSSSISYKPTTSTWRWFLISSERFSADQWTTKWKETGRSFSYRMVSV